MFNQFSLYDDEIETFLYNNDFTSIKYNTVYAFLLLDRRYEIARIKKTEFGTISNVRLN